MMRRNDVFGKCRHFTDFNNDNLWSCEPWIPNSRAPFPSASWFLSGVHDLGEAFISKKTLRRRRRLRPMRYLCPQEVCTRGYEKESVFSLGRFQATAFRLERKSTGKVKFKATSFWSSETCAIRIPIEYYKYKKLTNYKSPFISAASLWVRCSSFAFVNDIQFCG